MYGWKVREKTNKLIHFNVMVSLQFYPLGLKWKYMCYKLNHEDWHEVMRRWLLMIFPATYNYNIHNCLSFLSNNKKRTNIKYRTVTAGESCWASPVFSVAVLRSAADDRTAHCDHLLMTILRSRLGFRVTISLGRVMQYVLIQIAIQTRVCVFLRLCPGSSLAPLLSPHPSARSTNHLLPAPALGPRPLYL